MYFYYFQRFYRYHKNRLKTQIYSEDDESREFLSSMINILKKCWKQYLNTYLVFSVSYTIFPAILVDIKPINESLYFVPNKYYVPITCYLFFNGSSTFGSLVSNFISTEKSTHNLFCILTLIRLLFIPFFLFCNLSPDLRQWPVLINSDIIYIAANFILGFSNGFLGSLSIMCAPKCVSQKHSFLAGMLSSLFLMSGVMTGFFLSYLLLYIVEYEQL
jgi:equilibrative nucleoside transporter 1/2/3